MAFRMYSLFVENPPHGQDKFVLVEGGFACALDLVKYIRLKYGDYFGVTIAGYPEAHPDVIASEEGAVEEAYKKDLVYLKSKVDAGSSSQVDDDEELARTLQASLDIASPPRPEPTPSYQTPYTYPSGYRICAGCNTEIGYGHFLSCMGDVWHPQCFRCHPCREPISDNEFSMSGNGPYHKSYYKELYHPKYDVCEQFIPTDRAGLIEYRAHPFWGKRYCPSHEQDNTPCCCSCECMEQRNEQYISLDDGRRLCLKCLDSAIMDISEC